MTLDNTKNNKIYQNSNKLKKLKGTQIKNLSKKKQKIIQARLRNTAKDTVKNANLQKSLTRNKNIIQKKNKLLSSQISLTFKSSANFRLKIISSIITNKPIFFSSVDLTPKKLLFLKAICSLTSSSYIKSHSSLSFIPSATLSSVESTISTGTEPISYFVLYTIPLFFLASRQQKKLSWTFIGNTNSLPEASDSFSADTLMFYCLVQLKNIFEETELSFFFESINISVLKRSFGKEGKVVLSFEAKEEADLSSTSVLSSYGSRLSRETTVEIGRAAEEEEEKRMEWKSCIGSLTFDRQLSKCSQSFKEIVRSVREAVKEKITGDKRDGARKRIRFDHSNLHVRTIQEKVCAKKGEVVPAALLVACKDTRNNYMYTEVSFDANKEKGVIEEILNKCLGKLASLLGRNIRLHPKMIPVYLLIASICPKNIFFKIDVDTKASDKYGVVEENGGKDRRQKKEDYLGLINMFFGNSPSLKIEKTYAQIRIRGSDLLKGVIKNGPTK